MMHLAKEEQLAKFKPFLKIPVFSTLGAILSVCKATGGDRKELKKCSFLPHAVLWFVNVRDGKTWQHEKEHLIERSFRLLSIKKYNFISNNLILDFRNRRR